MRTISNLAGTVTTQTIMVLGDSGTLTQDIGNKNPRQNQKTIILVLRIRSPIWTPPHTGVQN